MNTNPTNKISVTLVSDRGDVPGKLMDVVWLEPLESGFFKRLKVSIGVGFNMTKANNLKQVNTRSNASYLADNWVAQASFDAVQSSQDDAEDTKRTEGNASYRYLLPHDWFALLSSTFLQNDEQ